jgi:hypothetical protein
MKLYATTTSERASKGQGGNKYLDIVITAGENREKIARYIFEINEGGKLKVTKWETLPIMVDLALSKGKQKKDESFEYHIGARYIDCKGKNTDYCNKCGYTKTKGKQKKDEKKYLTPIEFENKYSK